MENELTGLSGIDAVVKQPSKKSKSKSKKETTNEENIISNQELPDGEPLLPRNDLLSSGNDGDSNRSASTELPSEEAEVQKSDTKEESRKEVRKEEVTRPKTTAELLADAARQSRQRVAAHRAKQAEMSRWHRGQPITKK